MMVGAKFFKLEERKPRVQVSHWLGEWVEPSADRVRALGDDGSRCPRPHKKNYSAGPYSAGLPPPPKRERSRLRRSPTEEQALSPPLREYFRGLSLPLFASCLGCGDPHCNPRRLKMVTFPSYSIPTPRSRSIIKLFPTSRCQSLVHVSLVAVAINRGIVEESDHGYRRDPG